MMSIILDNCCATMASQGSKMAACKWLKFETPTTILTKYWHKNILKTLKRQQRDIIYFFDLIFWEKCKATYNDRNWPKLYSKFELTSMEGKLCAEIWLEGILKRTAEPRLCEGQGILWSLLCFCGIMHNNWSLQCN